MKENMKRLLFMFLFVSVLVSCDAYEDMSGMFEKQAKVQEFIKQNNDLEAQVGFNINNRTLTQVTVYFQSSEVGDKSVSELEKIALEAVASSFKLTPETLNVVVQSVPDSSVYEDLQEKLQTQEEKAQEMK
jgi:hypothetical protein